MMTSAIMALALPMPLASVMRAMNRSRIFSLAASTSSTPISGITLAVKMTFLPEPAKSPSTSSYADLLPATMTLVTPGQRASMAALCVMTFLLPPSVPPVSSTMSGAISPMSRSSDSESSNEKEPTILAPAPRAALRPASVVYSGTSPTHTTRRPPAALLQATVWCRSASVVETVLESREKASSRPMVMSRPTVEGTCTRASNSSASRSKATSLVKVLPKSTKSRTGCGKARPRLPIFIDLPALGLRACYERSARFLLRSAFRSAIPTRMSVSGG